MHFSETLSYLDRLQVQVSNSLGVNHDELQVLKETFTSNMQLVREMVKSLEERIDKLK